MDRDDRRVAKEARRLRHRATQLELKQRRAAERMARRRAFVRPTDEEIVEIVASRPIPDDDTDIAGFAFQCLSQHGEAGIVYELLRRIGSPTRTCVEIGCGSNGGNSGLLACLGYRSLMIDGDEALVEIARSCFDGLDVTAIDSWVSRETVNELMAHHGFTGDIDYLGIDLDGVDYWIWKAIRQVRPSLVVCEYNRLLGPEVSATIPYASTFRRKVAGMPKGYFGVSLAGLSSLGERLGFRLVATHHDNAFFLRNDLCPELRAITPSEGWTLRTKGNSARNYELVKATGVFEFFEQAGYPLIDLSTPTTDQ